LGGWASYPQVYPQTTNPNPSPDDRESMSITIKNRIAEYIAGILQMGAVYPTMWHDLYDWYDEVRDLDIADHYIIAELKELGVGYTNDELITALNDIKVAIERDIREAEKQDRWETRYWHERDYGGRL
jgi:hypothetical protein